MVPVDVGPGGVCWLAPWRLWRRWGVAHRRRTMMRVRVSTVALWVALLLGIHILLSDWDNDTPYPSEPRRPRKPGFAPRQLPAKQRSPCQLRPNPVSEDTDKPVTKVLLLTYLRAGGALIGQLFDKSENTTFWSEPIDGILSDMYGTYHGWHPLDMFTNQEGLPRHVPVCEEEAIVQHLSALYSCHLDTVPVDILTMPDAIIPSWRTRHYMPCLRDVLADIRPHNPSGYSSNVVLACKELIVKQCPKTFSFAQKVLYRCFERIQDLKTKMHLLLNEFKANREREGPLWVDTEADSPFHAYGKCMAAVSHHFQKCLPLFTSTCNNSDMIVVKSTRLRGEQVARLMDKHQDLKVVYFVRDPRGMALSREKSGQLSEVSQSNYINEAVLLCQRMHFDIAYLNLLKHKYPNRIIRLHYEEFLQNPEKAGTNVYSFLEKEIPAKTKSWLNFKMGQLREEGPDGEVTLKNMTGLAYKWRRQMPDVDNKYIVRKCAQVLRSLNYPFL